MIYLIAPGHSDDAATIVCSALERSSGYGQSRRIGFNEWLSKQKDFPKLLSVFINPLEAWSTEIVKSFQSAQHKTLLLGVLPDTIATHFGAEVAPVSEEQMLAAQCEPAPTYGQSNSALSIVYNDIKGFSSPISRRACLRYDFTDEWNNLGFGAVRTDGSIWGLSQAVNLPFAHALANLKIGQREIGAYAGAWCKDSYAAGAVLWFNRPVGPVDSPEWRIVERFLSSTGFPECACQPVLAEIPYGYAAAVTMRLDCDEDVESARALWQVYKAMHVPFSLALHARVLEDPRHHVLPREVLQTGGALLSHTASHAPNWGGSYDAAYEEGVVSADAIKAATGYQVRYAVSPFHQTPVYARSGLSDAGYDGCVGGIIRNDYDFLMARSGVPPWGTESFIGHTQQCMLHGDCMLSGRDPLAIFKEAFELAKASRTFFGYLDHPFSERYQYGWSTEDQRIAMHEQFVGYMRRNENVLFMNENDAMDFLHDRASVQVGSIFNSTSLKSAIKPRSKYLQSAEYGDETYLLTDAEVLL